MIAQLWTWTLAWVFFHHPSTLTRNSESRPYHNMWTGRVFENCCFMHLFGGSLLRTGGLLLLLSLDLWSKWLKLHLNQVESLGLLSPWNYDSLKSGKRTHSVWNGPFLGGLMWCLVEILCKFHASYPPPTMISHPSLLMSVIFAMPMWLSSCHDCWSTAVMNVDTWPSKQAWHTFFLYTRSASLQPLMAIDAGMWVTSG